MKETAFNTMVRRNVERQARDADATIATAQVLADMAVLMHHNTKRVKVRQTHLATRLGLSDRTVRRSITWLKAAKFLVDHDAGWRNHAHVYELRCDWSFSTVLSTEATQKQASNVIPLPTSYPGPRSKKMGFKKPNTKAGECNVCATSVGVTAGQAVLFPVGFRLMCEQCTPMAVALARSGAHGEAFPTPPDLRHWWANQYLTGAVNNARGGLPKP